ncbi:MAG: mediator of RNA polymerase II transcription subunit 13 [Candelina submexicana]|nr:MAG: mediator of RNA polymerase II transcription subunit 13 [Candelina submexicana]
MLRKLEFSCREGNILACLHPKNDEIWLFEAAEQPNRLNELMGEATEIDGGAGVHLFGHECTQLKSGVLRASALEIRPSAARRSTASTSAPQSANEHNVRSAQAANIRSVQVNASMNIPRSSISLAASAPASGAKAQKPTGETLASYELFVSAIVSALSYSLIKYHEYLPLDFRTFALPSKRTTLDGEDKPVQGSHIASQTVSLETLDVRLTSTGTLVVSSKYLQPSALRQMPSTPARPKHTKLWLAPGGRMARYLGLAPRSNQIESDWHPSKSPCWDQEQTRRRIMPSANKLGWENDVHDWLHGYGIVIDSKDAHSWLKVQLEPCSRYPVAKDNDGNVQNTRLKLKTITWPAKLCFEYTLLDNVRGATSDRDSGLDGGIEWLMAPEHGGVQDPLAFAEDWFAGQEEREQLIRSRTTARDLARMSAESAATNTQNQIQSPAVINALRTNNHGDLQAASGFYPTPPDGIQSQGATASSMPDMPGATPASAGDHPLYSNDDMKADDINAPEDHTSTRSSIEDIDIEHGQTGTGGPFGVEAGPPSIEQSTNNETFEELDEAMFGGNAVTEEDFSFFDGPDIDDLDLDTMGQYPVSTAEHGAFTSTADVDLAPPFNSTKERLSETSTQHFAKVATVGNGTVQDNEESDKLILNATVDEHIAKAESSIQSKESEATRGTARYSGSIECANVALQKPDLLSPPLSPVLVKRKLLPASMTPKSRPSMSEQAIRDEANNKSAPPQSSLQSNFDAVAFNRTLTLTDHKYASDGRFWFLAKDGDVKEIPIEVSNDSSRDTVLPLIGSLRNDHNTLGDKLTSMVHDEADSPALRTRTSPVTPPTDNESSDSSPEDIEIQSGNRLILDKAHKMLEQIQSESAAVKRKRDISDIGDGDGDGDNDNDAATSSLGSPRDSTPCAGSECLDENPPSPWEILLPDVAAYSIAEYVGVIHNEKGFSFGLEGEQLLIVAQILVDQLISGTLQPLKDHIRPGLVNEAFQSSNLEHLHRSRIKEATKSAFGNATPCDLHTFLAIEDLPPEPPLVGRVPLRPVHRRASTNKLVPLDNGTTNHASSVFRLPSPHVRVRRAEATMEVLPSALPFWETFGLSPCSGPKDVTACCIYPGGQGVENAAVKFIERIGTVYESCRLGSHTLAGDLNRWENGMISVWLDGLDKDKLNLGLAMRQFHDTCNELGQYLPGTLFTGQNVVIYLINPFEHPTALVGVSAAFASLCQAYLESSEYCKTSIKKIVLQIIPIDFITCASSVVVPSQSEYLDLALEVYERCRSSEDIPTAHSRLTGLAPSIALAKPVPKRIGFKLSSEPPATLLHETPCLHVAYSQSLDNRWLSAAWTDNQGRSQTYVSYCLGIKGSSHPLRPFREVAEEIWRTTLEMTATRKVTWRVFIVKVGVMERKEVDLWTAFATQQVQPVATIILLGTDPNPTLSVHPPSLQLSSGGFTQTGTYTAPVATPQSSLSPDQFGNSTTSSAILASSAGAASAQASTDTPIDLDVESTLIDVTDETWGLIPSHRLHNTHSLVDINPALVSGYLLKRASAHDEKPFAILGVNLLWVSGGQQQRPTAVLKEVLGMYRGLSTLARAKGVIGVDSTEPWHVAAARKAASGLGWLM